MARVKNLLQQRQYERMIYEDLSTGAALQKKFLTPEIDLIAVFKKCGYKVHAYNSPCSTVSGDFFILYRLVTVHAGYFLLMPQGTVCPLIKFHAHYRFTPDHVLCEQFSCKPSAIAQ